MKATDFDFRANLDFRPTDGHVLFHGARMLLFKADAIGLLREGLLQELGWEKARAIFLQCGYESGYSDFVQMKVAYRFESERELLAAGPVIHSWEGIVNAVARDLSYDRESGAFQFTGVWRNSFEAEQHLMQGEPAEQPTCWLLMGYASGWCTAFFGRPLLAIEPVCMGMGHDHCEWDIRPPDAWGETGAPYVDALSRFWEDR